MSGAVRGFRVLPLGSRAPTCPSQSLPDLSCFLPLCWPRILSPFLLPLCPRLSGTDLAQALVAKESIARKKAAMSGDVAKSLARLSTGLYVVTAQHNNARSAMVASWVSQVRALAWPLEGRCDGQRFLAVGGSASDSIVYSL